jgi:hypothetical protein
MQTASGARATVREARNEGLIMTAAQSNVERNRILDQAISSRDRPVISGNLDASGAFTSPTSQSTARPPRPKWYGKTLTSPLIIVLFSVLSFVTCGLFLPIWFYRTLRPNKFAQTIFMDENGLQNWGMAPIPQSQRVLSVLVLIGIVLGVIWAMNMWHTAQTGS